MSDAAFEAEVEVDPAAGPGEEAPPRRFRLGDRVVEVLELLDRWPGADHLYVKLRGSDGATYILRHDRARGGWRLVLYRAEAAEAAGDRVGESGRA